MFCSPSPGGKLPTRSALFNSCLSRQPGVSFSIACTLLCLILSGVSASAQTRSLSASDRGETRSRRSDAQTRTDAADPAGVNNTKQSERPSLVRKTALVYTPRAENQNTVRPTLTNDFVIISEAPPARIVNAAKASPAGANVPSIWPVIGLLRGGVGIRSNPFGGSALEYHKGQDISAPSGAPVNATADGVVVIARWMRGYGNGIYVDHGNGISTRYGHLSRIDVVEGQIVRRGDHLGLVGSTGRSTGPHLHYEVRVNGQPVSPLPYLPPSMIPPPAAERSLQR